MQPARHEEGGALRVGGEPAEGFARRWREAADAYGSVMRRKAAHVERRLLVTAERAMELWDRSLQQVVRCDEPPMTCLVLGVLPQPGAAA